MTIETNATRRAVLAAGAGGAGAVLLAACSSSAATTNAPASAGAPSSGSASPSGSAAPGSGGAGGGTAIAALADVPVGSSISVTLPDGPGLVTRTSNDAVVCFSAICTHQGCTVAPAGTVLRCPCHHSEFDPKSGDVKAGPAPAPLSKVAVSVVGGKIVTA